MNKYYEFIESNCADNEYFRLIYGSIVIPMQLSPINHFPDNSINLASAQLVRKHADAYSATEKLLMQVNH